MKGPLVLILGLVAFCAALVAVNITWSALTPDDQGRSVVDTGPYPERKAGGLMFASRHDLAICVDGVNFPPAAVEALRQEVVNAIPAMKSGKDWTWYFPTSKGHVRVEIGCPEWSRLDYSTAVTRPSEFTMFLNMVPELPEEQRRYHVAGGGDEMICGGDDCFQVTRSIRVTEEALCDQDWFTSMLMIELALSGSTTSSFSGCT